MLVSTSHNFIFVHIAKNGGSSLRSFLQQYHAGRNDRTWRTDIKADLPFPQAPHKIAFHPHPTARWARQKFGAAFFDNAFSFAFVRNPWDRAVSRYEYVRHAQGHGQHKRFQTMSFDKFIRDEWFRNLLVSRTQLSEISDKNGNIIISKVYRFEDMDNAIADICSRLNIPALARTPHNNPSKRARYNDYFNKKNKRLFDRIYREDIDRFGYSF